MQCFMLLGIGTRGDVQPILCLASALAVKYPQARIVVGAHQEFEDFVIGHGSGRFEFFPIEPSTIHILKSTKEGRTVKSSKNPFKVMSALRKINNQMVSSIFESVEAAFEKFKPTLLLMPLMAFFADIQYLARERYKIPFIVVHTVPTQSTGDFAPPTANMGLNTGHTWINKIAWNVGAFMSYHIAFKDPVNKVRKLRNYPSRNMSFQSEIDKKHVPCMYVYSAAVLPKPSDWPLNHKIVGYLSIPTESQSQEPLSPQLSWFIDANRKVNNAVVYISLGSMLNVIFDTDVQVREVLEKLILGSVMSMAEVNMSVILHVSAGQAHEIVYPILEALPTKKPIFILDKPVAHAKLFPMLQMVVHHGGMGTTHATLLSGRPAIVLPCGPTSDQPFWADIIQKRKLGLHGGHIAELTINRFSALLVEAINNIETYTANVSTVQAQMIAEHGDERALEMIADLLI